jgi:hypothetical protein
VPVYWPGGVRHVGGASPVCGSCMERGKACHDTAACRLGGERERPEAETVGTEYRRVGALADRLVVVVKPL